MAMFIRIHPFNPQRGFKVRRFVYRGQRFEEERGWYRVTDEFAEEVRDLRQDAYNPDSKPVFQVADADEAKKLSVKDYEEANPTVKIQQAIEGSQEVEETKLDPEPPAAKEKKAKRGRGRKKADKKEKKGTTTTDDLPSSGSNEDHVFG